MDYNQSDTQIAYLRDLAQQLSSCVQRVSDMRASMERSAANHGPTGIVFSPPAIEAQSIRSLDQSWLQCSLAVQLLTSALDDRRLTILSKWPDP